MLITNNTNADYWFGPLHLPAGIGQMLTVDDSSATSLYLTSDAVADSIIRLSAAGKVSVSSVSAGINFPRATGDPQVLHGDGAPEGLLFANQGSLYLRRDAAGAANYLYTKTTGNNLNTGWTAINPGGGAIVATGVSGLGAGSSGVLGLIRAGSSPYYFVPVTYDATYAHWVTEEFAIGQSPMSAISTAVQNTTSTDVDAVSNNPQYYSRGSVKWRDFDTAGLSVQLRAVFEYWNASSSFSNYKFGWSSRNTGTSGWATTTIVLTGPVNSHNVTSPDFVDTGWQSVTAGYTVADYFAPVLQIYTSLDSGAQCFIRNIRTWVRFVG